MSQNSEEAKKAPSGWRGAIKRIVSIHLSRFWEGIIVGVIGGVIATVIATPIVNKFLPPSNPDDIEKEHIETLIANEAKFARVHDLQRYRDLFAEDAWVIESTTQQTWVHQDRIVERLKPLHFTELIHTPKQVSVTRDGSVAFAETTTTFKQVDPDACCSGKEYWQFRKIDGTWKIVSFQYALP